MTINMAKYMSERRARRRQQLIDIKGGICATCGSTDRLEFDHRVPGSQRFRLSGSGLDTAWTKILDELQRCDLLCRSCHLGKTKASGETGGGHNKNLSPFKHGTMRMYHEQKCRCEPCRAARRIYRTGSVTYSGS